MSRAEAWLLHVAHLLVGGTGLVYAWMLYFLDPIDEFSILNHPWQDETQALHILTAPLLVFAGAWIWKTHVWKRLSSGQKRRRISGLALTFTLFPMIASGYFLQISIEPSWHQAWLVIHLSTSGLWLAAYLKHQFRFRLRFRLPE
jgi:hypothetical protein